MAISANTEWEVRAVQATSSLHGGGFDPAFGGVDYSQSDTYLYNGTFECTDVAAVNPVITCPGRPFVAADAGNVICVTAGTNLVLGGTGRKRFQIIAVDVGTGAATLDRALGAAGATVDGAFYLGGALYWSNSTWYLEWLTNEAEPGNKIWIKGDPAGQHVLTGLVTSYNSRQIASIEANLNLGTVLGAGTSTAQIVLEGYHTVRGDAPTGIQQPRFNCQGFTLTLGAYYRCKYISFEGNGTSVLTVGANFQMVNCTVINNSSTASRVGLTLGGAGNVVIGSEFVSQRGTALSTNTRGGYFVGNYIHDSNVGVLSASAAAFWTNNIIAACATTGVSFSAGATTQVVFQNNTFYGMETPLGTALSLSSSSNVSLLGNIFCGWVTAITHATVGGIEANTGDNNIFYNNTNNATNWDLGPSSVIGTSPNFSDVTQYAIATATMPGNGRLGVPTAQDLSGIVPFRDWVYAVSGTSVNWHAGMFYQITGIDQQDAFTKRIHLGAQTLPTSQMTGDKSFRIIRGRNWSPGSAMRGVSLPQVFPFIPTESIVDAGAAQRDDTAGCPVSTDPGEGNVLDGTEYIINDEAKTGTLAAGGGSGISKGRLVNAGG